MSTPEQHIRPDLIETYEDAPDGPYCPHCGQELEYERCDAIGCEDGWIDSDTLMEEDPLWYGPDDTERCDQCDGKGGWWWCTNRECRSKKESDD